MSQTVMVKYVNEDAKRDVEFMLEKLKRKHIPMKERIKDFNGEYSFEEWDTGNVVGIEVVQ